MFRYIYIFIYSFIYLFIYYLFIYLVIYLFIYLCIYMCKSQFPWHLLGKKLQFGRSSGPGFGLLPRDGKSVDKFQLRFQVLETQPILRRNRNPAVLQSLTYENWRMKSPNIHGSNAMFFWGDSLKKNPCFVPTHCSNEAASFGCFSCRMSCIRTKSSPRLECPRNHPLSLIMSMTWKHHPLKPVL